MSAGSASRDSDGPGSGNSGPLILGVDGGGTKTDVWLARVDSGDKFTVLGRSRGPSTNPRAVGVEPALSNLASAVGDAWRNAGLDAERVASVVMAISGAGRPEMRERFVEWALGAGVARRAEVVHDAEPLLAEGVPAGAGVGLIVGTGSAAIAADRTGRRYVTGGWGYWFGDEGSGYAIGRQALAAAARAVDGRGDATALVGALSERLGVAEPRGFLAALEGAGDVRRAIAGLADAVLATAATGDATARDIVEQAAADLAEMVAVAAEQLKLGPKFPLALAGGVACGGVLLRERLAAALAARGVRVEPVTVVAHPVAGCLRLAARGLGNGASAGGAPGG